MIANPCLEKRQEGSSKLNAFNGVMQYLETFGWQRSGLVLLGCLGLQSSVGIVNGSGSLVEREVRRQARNRKDRNAGNHSFVKSDSMPWQYICYECLDKLGKSLHEAGRPRVYEIGPAMWGV